jgi:hypothetical protein
MKIGTLVVLRNDEDRLGIIKAISGEGWTIVELLSGSTIEANLDHFKPAN